jgi:hypothetical protein
MNHAPMATGCDLFGRIRATDRMFLPVFACLLLRNLLFLRTFLL